MIVLLRSTDGSPDSRFEKYVDFLDSQGIDYLTLCWDRKNIKRNDNNHLYYKKSSVYGKRWKNLGGHLGFYWFLLKTLFSQRKRYQVIHACDLDTVIPAVFARVFLGKKYIYDVFDWFVDSNNIQGIIKYFVYAIEFINIKLANAVIVCEKERVKQILFKPRKLWILPNIPNMTNMSLPESSNNEKLTISYVGILSVNRGIEYLVEYAKKHPENVNIKVAGFGKLEYLFEDSNSFSNIKYYGSVSYQRALDIMCSADVIMAIYEKTDKNQILAAPNKYYEGLCLGKPIITTIGTIPGNRSIEDNTGYAIDEQYSDLESLINSISFDDIKIKSKNAKLLWDRKYSNYVQNFLLNQYLPFVKMCQK